MSKWQTVLIPPGASSFNSGHVSPSLALFCVVAKTGMFKIWLALSNFCVVATTLGNAWMAGRNFSCKSQTKSAGFGILCWTMVGGQRKCSSCASGAWCGRQERERIRKWGRVRRVGQWVACRVLNMMVRNSALMTIAWSERHRGV